MFSRIRRFITDDTNLSWFGCGMYLLKVSIAWPDYLTKILEGRKDLFVLMVWGGQSGSWQRRKSGRLFMSMRGCSWDSSTLRRQKQVTEANQEVRLGCEVWALPLPLRISTATSLGPSIYINQCIRKMSYSTHTLRNVKNKKVLQQDYSIFSFQCQFRPVCHMSGEQSETKEPTFEE